MGKDKTPHLQTEREAPFIHVQLLFARKMLELGFHDAMATRDGEPTEAAHEAYLWIERKTDWTRYGFPAPSDEDTRRELWGQFDWCCRWLDLDPDCVRAEGLPKPAAPKFTEYKEPRRFHVAGLPAIRAAWAKAKEKHEQAARERQGTRTDLVANLPPSSDFGKSRDQAARVSPPRRRLPACAGLDLTSRYLAYKEFCGLLAVPPMTPQLWRIYA